MKIQEKIELSIREAMKEKNSDKLIALRSIKSEMLLESAKGVDKIISEEIFINIVTKLVKQRKDSAKIYIEQNRQDLADEELSQLKYIEVYLPKQISETEIILEVQAVIKQIGASNISDFGRCMGLLVKKLKGKADSSIVSRLLKGQLEKL